MSILYHIYVQIASIGTHRLCSKPKSQKNVCANNNCHLKVYNRTDEVLLFQVGRVHFCVSGVLLAASAEINSTQVI